jgi:hypothetical protein
VTDKEQEKVDFNIRKLEFGIDGLPYAIFRWEDDAVMYLESVGGIHTSCFDGYHNAVLLQCTLGM